MLVVCRSCARQLRVFNLSGGAWGHCKTGSQLAALYIAVRSKTTEPEECPKTPVGDARKGVTGAMFSTASAAAPLEQQSPHCLYDATKHTPEVTVNRLTSGSLESLMEGFCQRPGVQLAAVDMGIPEHIVHESLQSFKASLTCSTAYISKQPNLQKLLSDVIAGSAHIDDIFPYYLNYTQEKYHSVIEATKHTPEVTLTSDSLESLMEGFCQRPGVQLAAVEMGFPEHILDKSLQSFKASLTCTAYISKQPNLQKLLGDVIAGSAHIDELFPYYLKHTREKYPAVTLIPQLREISNLSEPHLWYPRARAFKRRFTYHAGPTNSGKTHHALEKFLAANSAIYCAPLRMLAHEIYRRSNARGTMCDLVTGDEKQFGSGSEDSPSNHMSCTVEMANMDNYYDVAVVDEVQMLGDQDRGGAWTRAILGLPALEIHLCGHESALPLVRRLLDCTGDHIEVCRYERLSPLVPLPDSLDGDFKKIKDGDCMVVFSRERLFKIRRKIQSVTNKPCAVIYGGLPSATRVQQAELFNSHDDPCNIMVATDAIGMGLNLNIHRVILYDLTKYDGRSGGRTEISSAHLKQISGRAGRYRYSYDQGEVTTFYAHDLQKLHKLLSKPEDDIKQAGLYPTCEQIQQFSNLLPGSSFHNVLKLFFKMAQLDDTFFLCHVEKQLVGASHLQEQKLPLPVMYTMSLAPVEKEYGLEVLKQFATDYSDGKCVSYSRLCEIVQWPRRSPFSPVQLMIFEQIHEAVDLYLWLSMRFPECFDAAEEARELQRTVEREIARYIGKRHHQSISSAPTTTKNGNSNSSYSRYLPWRTRVGSVAGYKKGAFAAKRKH